MQLLHRILRQLMLVLLNEMEEFLVAAMEASGTVTDLEQCKMRAADGQRALTRLLQVFAAGARSILESN